MSNALGAITSRNDFHDALRSGFAEAATAGCRELCLLDADFADWPLGEREVVESLTHWVGSQRRLTLLANGYDAVVRRHARWVEWRRQWSHVVQCFAPTELEVAPVPTVLWAAGLLQVSLQDRVHHRGVWSRDAGDLLRGKERIDAHLQRSTPAFPVTVAGL